MVKSRCSPEEQVASLNRRASETLQNLRRRRLEICMRVRPSVIEHIWSKVLSMGLAEETMVVPESGVVKSLQAQANENKRRRAASGTVLTQPLGDITREAGIVDLVPPRAHTFEELPMVALRDKVLPGVDPMIPAARICAR